MGLFFLFDFKSGNRPNKLTVPSIDAWIGAELLTLTAPLFLGEDHGSCRVVAPLRSHISSSSTTLFVLVPFRRHGSTPTESPLVYPKTSLLGRCLCAPVCRGASGSRARTVSLRLTSPGSCHGTNRVPPTTVSGGST